MDWKAPHVNVQLFIYVKNNSLQKQQQKHKSVQHWSNVLLRKYKSDSTNGKAKTQMQKPQPKSNSNNVFM